MFQTAKMVPTTTDVPTTPIGLGKPLSIRALSSTRGATTTDSCSSPHP